MWEDGTDRLAAHLIDTGVGDLALVIGYVRRSYEAIVFTRDEEDAIVFTR